LRTESVGDRWFAGAAGALVLVAAAGLGGLLFGEQGALGGGVLGLWAGFGLHRALGLRAERRRALLAAPFPEAWRRFLRERCDPYQRIPADLRGRFEDDLRVFVAEKRITGVGIEATEELKLLVAASAVTLSLGWPHYEWDRLSEVLLYPQDFDRDYGFEMRELSGQAHGWGTVILSAPALIESFAHPDDGYHVGIHEFAHLVQVDQSRFAEIPLGLGAAPSRQVGARSLRGGESQRVPGRGRGGLLRDTAGPARAAPRGLRHPGGVFPAGPRRLGRGAGTVKAGLS
jgi:hypothetical protein